uniref:Uncharacterized protein n=1 Tax=Rousettus aegyptiacus TaxID=9407 RepID=A0A7J8DI26_ROUAE|nr:hypothetical protein HJG63_008568 [Rousettus aegyptiacus]
MFFQIGTRTPQRGRATNWTHGREGLNSPEAAARTSEKTVQTDFTGSYKDNMPCFSHKPEAGWSTHGRSLRNIIVGLLIIRDIGEGGNLEEKTKLYIQVTKGQWGQRIFYSYYKCQRTQKGTCTYI